jgi:hypothetical protein
MYQLNDSVGFGGSGEGIAMRFGVLSDSHQNRILQKFTLSVNARVWSSVLQDVRSATKMQILHSILWAHLSARHVRAPVSCTPKLRSHYGRLVSLRKRIRVYRPRFAFLKVNQQTKTNCSYN